MSEAVKSINPSPYHVSSWLSKVILRPIQRRDLPALEWEGEYKHFRRVYLEVFRRMRSGLANMWAAELLAEGIIGQVFVQYSSGKQELADGANRAYVHSFRVKPSFRGAGLGSKLMHVVETDLIQRGYKHVTLNVSYTNPGARRLYSLLGYRIVGPDPGIWSFQDDSGALQQVNDPGWRMHKRLG
jgi:ribosomal protein S18 acetylase RimI-like enzyme